MFVDSTVEITLRHSSESVEFTNGRDSAFKVDNILGVKNEVFNVQIAQLLLLYLPMRDHPRP